MNVLIGDIINNVNIGLYSGHILTLFLFSIALTLIIKELIYVRHNLKVCNNPNIRVTLYTALYSSMIVTITFIVLQLDWIISDYNSEVGNTTSFMWLVFDVFLGIFFISFTVFVKCVRSAYEYIQRLERIIKERHNIECTSGTLFDTDTSSTEKVIKDSVEESKEGLRVLRKRIVMKNDDSVINHDLS